MDEIQHNKQTIQALFAEGVISQMWVSPSALTDILQRMDKGEIKVWSNPDFNPTKEPELHLGVSICYDCGRMYWVIPKEDAYERSDGGEGRICDPCLIKPITGKDEVDSYIFERDISLN